ncbi:hypothetical protein [Bradyrhizobium sp. Leo170]|uniref:hypothetical protein n=1 Tax=Bradyrhizobium sp. Leo170 TaxID=1571199 RepID=UPI00102EB222|nr:hypothetical protein [Bradyrhizobium sp. Leo170]TAI63464.1 hypothetical protein CWO89_24150 [Bradyrhizobium sp. Leo170]
MQTDSEIYLSDDRHSRLVQAILNAKPCPFAGHVTADQITMALGEVGSIWPEHSRGDMVIDALEHAERPRTKAA